MYNILGIFICIIQQKKRRLIGPTKENAMSNIINERIACETFREKEAHRLMKIGKLL